MTATQNPIEPLAAELLERDMCTAIIEYGKRFFGNPANHAKFDAWLVKRKEANT